MSPMERLTIRLSVVQIKQLELLSAKLQVDLVNVVRLAITRLAEREGIVVSTKNNPQP